MDTRALYRAVADLAFPRYSNPDSRYRRTSVGGQRKQEPQLEIDL
jgi:hypothetical protein